MNSALLSRLRRWKPTIYTADDMAEVDAERDVLFESREHWRKLAQERQQAIDLALATLTGSQYVGGSTEKGAWNRVWEILGPLETQHKGANVDAP